MMLELGSKVVARYLRLSLAERNFLHLAQVEILVRCEAERIYRLCLDCGFDYERLVLHPNDGKYVISNGSPPVPNRLVGLKIRRFGKFANNLLQTSNAIYLAKRLGLSYIQVTDFDLFQLNEPVVIDGITLLPPKIPLPNDGFFLEGSFFYGDVFGAKMSGIDPLRAEIVRSFIRPFLNLSSAFPPPEADELVVHIRSGDIFCETPHPGYIQPPLSYYVLVTERLMARGDVSRVCIVFEDRKNPCIDAYEDWLGKQGIPCRTQSGALQDDIECIRHARHMVFGRGTFGYGVCALADHVSSVHTFMSGSAYKMLPDIEHLTEARDATGAYIKPGGWRCTPEQLNLMITYPGENLAFHDLR
jgi:hypothetical protein